MRDSTTTVGAGVSRASAIVLAAGGAALLFASDTILPRLAPGFPTESAWIGQLIAAAWLGVAALNWLGQSALLGGIYGRPQVLCNAALYFVTGTSVAGFVRRSPAPPALWALLAISAVFAAAYGWLLLRGPFERDFARARASLPARDTGTS